MKPSKQTLVFQTLDLPVIQFQIVLSDSSLFYLPQVVMMNTKEILFTQLGNRGQVEIYHYDRLQKKREKIFQSTGPMERIELCSFENQTFLLQRGLGTFPRGTTISVFLTKEWKKIKEARSLYDSELNDLGSLNCTFDKNRLYFIRNYADQKKNQKLPLELYDVFSLDIKTKKLERLSYVEHASSIFQMGERLILPFRGRMLVIRGDANETPDRFN